MKKLLVGFVVTGALVLGAGGAAFAGETTGAELRGKGTRSHSGTSPTPKAPTVAQSECVFSGLDQPDSIEDPEGEFNDDEVMLHGTQSYGQFVAAGIPLPPFLHPGVACKGLPSQK